jgi:hypothetical protein
VQPELTPPAPGELTATPGEPYRLLPWSELPGDASPDDGDPGRPQSMRPEETGFRARRAVPWLSPTLLAATGLRVVLADQFGAYLDKRELQNALPAYLHSEGEDGEELWFDYVADLGDGFNATYSVAYLLAQPELTVGGERLPRGRFLVMGGDQVYPVPSGQQYEDRFKGPYRAALPTPPAGGRATMYALPGNHDWYDGLTAFLRLFARRAGGRVGGWRTKQSRSYFAIRLPQRWWLFALDSQSGAYLDDPQLQYFQAVAEKLTPGDRVIICPPTPDWVDATYNRKAYDTLDYFIRTVVAPTGARVRLMISGDLHHYARYTGPERELVTAGTGGAYLSATHRLPGTITVPPPTSIVRHPSPSQQYTLAETYPDKARSRWYAVGVFARLPLRNTRFVLLLGLLHALLMFGIVNASRRLSSVEERLITVPLAVVVLMILGAAVGFAMPETSGGRRTRHWILGFAHGFAHLALGVGGAALWQRSPFDTLTWPAPLVVAGLGYLPLAGLVASQVVGLYLLIASAVGVNVNELFAGQGIPDAKGFVRMRLGRDGSLTLYPLMVDRTSRKWRAAPTAPPDRPWFEPVTPLVVRLAEREPVRIPPEVPDQSPR